MAFYEEASDILYGYFKAAPKSDTFREGSGVTIDYNDYGGDADGGETPPGGGVVSFGSYTTKLGNSEDDGGFTHTFEAIIKRGCDAIADAWADYGNGWMVPVVPVVGGAGPPANGGAFGAGPMLIWTPGLLIPATPFNKVKSYYKHPDSGDQNLPTNHDAYGYWEHVWKGLDTVMTVVGTTFAMTWMLIPAAPTIDPASGCGWFLGPYGVPLPGPHSGSMGPPKTADMGLSAAFPAAGLMEMTIANMWKGLLLPKYSPLDLPNSKVPDLIDCYAFAIAEAWFTDFLPSVEFSAGTSTGVTVPGGTTAGVCMQIEIEHK